MTTQEIRAALRAELAAMAARGDVKGANALTRAVNRIDPPVDGNADQFEQLLAGMFVRARASLGPVDPTCYGAETEHREPACDGPDVRPVRAQAPGGEWFTTDWCAECRMAAEVQGYVIEPLPEVSGDAQ